jgi:hypothetical protein
MQRQIWMTLSIFFFKFMHSVQSILKACQDCYFLVVTTIYIAYAEFDNIYERYIKFGDIYETSVH